MKSIKLNIKDFEAFGGNISSIDLTKTKVIYLDKNRDKAIANIVSLGINDHGNKIFMVHFHDGSSYKYAAMWIETEVEFVLAEKYCIKHEAG